MNFSIQNKTLLVCAKRASGKSELVRYLVKNELHQFKKVFVFSPTEAVHKFYGDFVDKECIYHTYEDGLIEKMIEKLSVVNSNKTKHNASHILVILDDLISDIDFQLVNIFMPSPQSCEPMQIIYFVGNRISGLLKY